MRVNVLKSFPYAHDGQSTVFLTEGEADVRDELVPGLEGEGFIEQLKSEGKAPKSPKAPKGQAAADAAPEVAPES